MSAVEHRNRQEIHHAELQRDHRDEHDERDPTAAEHRAADARDRDRAAQFFHAAVAARNAADRFARELQHLQIFGDYAIEVENPRRQHLLPAEGQKLPS